MKQNTEIYEYHFLNTMPYQPKEKVDLPEGWVVKTFNHPNRTNNYHTFLSPTGKCFRSRYAINQFLEVSKTTNDNENEAFEGMVVKKIAVVKAVAVGTKKRKQSGAAAKKGIVVKAIAKQNAIQTVAKKVAVVKATVKKKAKETVFRLTNASFYAKIKATMNLEFTYVLFW